jgi:hypothetical protein
MFFQSQIQATTEWNLAKNNYTGFTNPDNLNHILNIFVNDPFHNCKLALQGVNTVGDALDLFNKHKLNVFVGDKMNGMPGVKAFQIKLVGDDGSYGKYNWSFMDTMFSYFGPGYVPPMPPYTGANNPDLTSYLINLENIAESVLNTITDIAAKSDLEKYIDTLGDILMAKSGAEDVVELRTNTSGTGWYDINIPDPEIMNWVMLPHMFDPNLNPPPAV